MARYTTPDGICGQGKTHQIKDAPGVRNKGYVSPIASRVSFSTPKVRLCRKHYLEAYAVRYPDTALPNLMR